jgi:hypothetical protein
MAAHARRYGADATIPERFVCSQRSSRNTDFVLTGTLPKDQRRL